MATRGTLEREVKLESEPGFALPDLPGQERPLRTFESTYFNSADGRLRRARMTLRRRDLDVLIRHLEAEVERLGEPAGATLVERLRAERTALEPALLASLTGKRWHALLDRLVEEPPRRAAPALEELAAAEASACASTRFPPMRPTSSCTTCVSE